MCFNVAYYFVNTLLPRSSFCYRISRTPIEEANKFLTKIISKNKLNLHGICIAVIIKSNYFYNGCAWIKKGLWQHEEDFCFVGFSFPLRLEPCVPRQSNVMAISARQE